MRVIDLFCGSGGISLGFQMAGHDVIYGLDNNKDAIETFGRNFPAAKTVCKKIEDFDVDDLPECDIIVGGPPCVNFSMAKGSRANVLEGVKLVQAFMRVVYYRKPKYWIMENVPRIGLHLPDKIPLRWIGIDADGLFEIPVRHEFDIQRYGSPQKRKRLLIGSYPIPAETHSPLSDGSFSFSGSLSKTKTLGDIVRALPDPRSSDFNGKVIDPNYGFEMAASDLTDHFVDTEMSDEEATSIRLAKTEHPYMGRMEFPDALDKPARTVVSLQMGRETLVIQSGSMRYRRATIRECATLQTFPLSFQFAGVTLNSRYKQAGNAVPPVLTFQIAKRIHEIESPSTLREPMIHFPKPFAPARASRPSISRSPNLRAGRIVRIPGKEVRGTRIEMQSSGYPDVRWDVTLHLGEGRATHTKVQYDLSDALTMVEATLAQNSSEEVLGRFSSLKREITEIKLPSSAELHSDLHFNRGKNWLVQKIERSLDTYFPSELFGGVDVPVAYPFDGLTKSKLRMRILVMIPILKLVEIGLNPSQSSTVSGAAVQHSIQPDKVFDFAG